MVNGIETKCMVEVFIDGLMENTMMVNMKTTKSLDLVFLIGLMESNTKVIGLMVNNMEKDL